MPVIPITARLLVTALVAVSVSQTRCADDASATGAAPVIADLTLTPSTIPAGQVVSVSGTMTFSDPDGDLALLVTELEITGGAVQPGPEVPLQGAAGVRVGTVPFQISLQSNVPGALTVRVWLVDAAGNSSNRLTEVIAVE